MRDVPARNWLLSALIALGIVAVFLSLRIRWFDHLLMWDEAMNLCAVRALASGGYDYFSYWIWRYPPLHNVLLLLEQPLREGYLTRAEWVPVLAGLATLPVLYALNRRALGRAAAAWSCLIWAMLPASVFFGLWIKQDALVPFFGLLAVLLFTNRRPLWSGLALGLAFLSKELAIFYALAVAILALIERRGRDLAVAALVCGLAAGWWFVLFSESVRYFLGYAAGSGAGVTEAWTKPALYYFARLTDDLGWPALLLAGIGAIAAGRAWRSSPRAASLWPFALLVPGYAILTAAQGKAPWYSMTLLPAWATLAALGVTALGVLARRVAGSLARSRIVPAAAGFALAALLLTPFAGRTYESVMREAEPGMWWASSASREAALALNALADSGDKVLITPMSYYDESLQIPCPVFTIYLDPMDVAVRANTLDAEDLVAEARAYRFAWAMVSPPADTATDRVIGPLIRDHGLRPMFLKGACVYRLRDVWDDGG